MKFHRFPDIYQTVSQLVYHVQAWDLESQRHDCIQLNIYLTARIENKYLKSQNVIGSHHLYMNILFTRVAEYNDIYQKGIWGSMVCSKLLMCTNSVYTHDWPYSSFFLYRRSDGYLSTCTPNLLHHPSRDMCGKCECTKSNRNRFMSSWWENFIVGLSIFFFWLRKWLQLANQLNRWYVRKWKQIPPAFKRCTKSYLVHLFRLLSQ